MKIDIEIEDELFAQAVEVAKDEGTTLSALVEEGLRLVTENGKDGQTLNRTERDE